VSRSRNKLRHVATYRVYAVCANTDIGFGGCPIFKVQHDSLLANLNIDCLLSKMDDVPGYVFLKCLVKMRTVIASGEVLVSFDGVVHVVVNDLACLPVTVDHRPVPFLPGADISRDDIVEAELLQSAQAVGPQADACTDLLELLGTFIDLHTDAWMSQESVCCDKTGDATTCDGDSQFAFVRNCVTLGHGGVWSTQRIVER
jgi:hypothetical protein